MKLGINMLRNVHPFLNKCIFQCLKRDWKWISASHVCQARPRHVGSFFLHSFITCVQVRASYSISSQYFFQSKNVGLEKCRVPFLVTKKAWDVLTGTWLYNCYWWSIWCPIPKVGTALRQHSIRKRDVNSRRHVSINTNVYIIAWFVMYPAMDGSLSVEG